MSKKTSPSLTETWSTNSRLDVYHELHGRENAKKAEELVQATYIKLIGYPVDISKNHHYSTSL